MWQRAQYVLNNLFLEILLRVIFLLVVCICQLKAQPYMRHITESELLTDYKRPRHDSYVPSWALVLLIVFVPLFCICTPFMWTKNFADTVQALLAWTLALTINAVATEFIKLIVGRPRPDYFWRCFPNGETTPGLSCTGNIYDVIEGRKSFPSGHSSFSFCSLGFLSIWLCGKLGVLSRSRGQACGVIVCLAPLVVASGVAVSRVCDNHHHWEDVLVGSMLGFTITYFCYHQYYHPLGSESSGEPYVMLDHEYFNDTCNDDIFDIYQIVLQNFAKSTQIKRTTMPKTHNNQSGITYVDALYSFMSKLHGYPIYEFLNKFGKAHKPWFRYRCEALAEEVFGTGRSKKDAKQVVARLMLQQLSLRGYKVPPQFASPEAAEMYKDQVGLPTLSFQSVVHDMCVNNRLSDLQYDYMPDPSKRYYILAKARVGYVERTASGPTRIIAADLAAEQVYKYLRSRLIGIRPVNQVQPTPRAPETAIAAPPEVPRAEQRRSDEEPGPSTSYGSYVRRNNKKKKTRRSIYIRVDFNQPQQGGSEVGPEGPPPPDTPFQGSNNVAINLLSRTMDRFGI
ncbi:hypothetical protein PYW08_000376 [Mythimna loreyi]|uniref:Uncharacterized protein n=1 Tax=Mythimna loreyi TaxID=667449 RepID=A0ACC2RCA8_9NEOP|nr:hypothetical protein PYW08_000376 [Mythimna loreyi]